MYRGFKIVILVVALFVLIKSNVRAHSVQVGYCISCTGDLRLYVEHWHNAEDPSSTTMTLELTVNGNTTNITGSPAGSLIDVAFADLPACSTPLTVFANCNDANTYNDWVIYDFPNVPCGVPLSFKIISGNTAFTEDGCGMYPATVNFTKSCATAPPTLSLASQTVCGGSSFAATNFPVGTGITYNWANDNTSIGLGASGTGDIPGFVASNVPATAVSTVTVTFGCFDTTFNLTVKPSPIVTVPADIEVCNNDNIPATNFVSAPAGGTFSWTNDNTAIGLGASGTGNIPSFTAVNTTSAPIVSVVSVTSVFDGCTGPPATYNITVNPTPTVNVPSNILVCDGDNISATNFTSIPAGGTFTWTNSNVSIGLAASGSGDITSFAAVNGGSSSVTSAITVIPEVAGCVGTPAVYAINVNALASANAGVNTFVCPYTSIQLAGSVGGSATTGSWSGGTGTYVPSSSALNAIYTPSSAEYLAGSVTLTLTTDDPVGPCGAVSDDITYSFYPNPVVNFNADVTSGCPLHCVNFTDFTVIAGDGSSITTWNWDFGDGSVETIPNPNHCYTQSGFYDVALTATSNNGCSATSTVNQMIEVFPKPTAEFGASPNPATILNSLVGFTNQSSSDVNYWAYYFGDGDSLVPSIPNVQHTYPTEQTSTYTASLIVQNSYGCYDTVAHDIIIGPDFIFYIPNSFSPNGDGINDFFNGLAIGCNEYQLWIYDRWGVQIYTTGKVASSDVATPWNGKANGGSDLAQIDVYIWKVQITDVFGKKHNYNGHVSLIR
ncbi:MAG: gliding motility-associated C-terminal domain-containing protein [Bacteroidetes bacterium]|nr:gliding motility-associated C-terminal domain-containing protein [Bacteroidota bacterium]